MNLYTKYVTIISHKHTTHISFNVEVSIGLQQNFYNFKVTNQTGYMQCCPSILYILYMEISELIIAARVMKAPRVLMPLVEAPNMKLLLYYRSIPIKFTLVQKVRNNRP